MKTQTIPHEYQHTSPAGAEVRLLMSNTMAGLAHCTLRAKTKFQNPWFTKALNLPHEIS